MENIELLILTAIALPFIGCGFNIVFYRLNNVRDLLTLVIAILTFACVLSILILFNNDSVGDFSLLSVMPGLEIAFHIEPHGL